MIGEGRLKGIIDQVGKNMLELSKYHNLNLCYFLIVFTERLLIFETKGSSIVKFNSEIANICDEVDFSNHFI